MIVTNDPQRDLIRVALGKLLTATEGSEELDVLVGAAGGLRLTLREYTRDMNAAYALVQSSAISKIKIEVVAVGIDAAEAVNIEFTAAGPNNETAVLRTGPRKTLPLALCIAAMKARMHRIIGDKVPT